MTELEIKLDRKLGRIIRDVERIANVAHLVLPAETKRRLEWVLREQETGELRPVEL